MSALSVVAVVIGAWVVVSVPVCLGVCRVLAKVSDDYPPLGGDDSPPIDDDVDWRE